MPIDVLLVVDTTIGAYEYLPRVHDSVGPLLDALAGRDFQIGVVSADLSSQEGKEAAGTLEVGFKSEPPFTWIDSSNSNCREISIAHACLRGVRADQRVVSSQLPREDQTAALRRNVDLGNCAAGQEQGLGAIVRALEQSQAGGCNAGFLREQAALLLVLISDDDDLTGESTHTPVPELVQQVLALKEASRVHLLWFVGAENGEPTRCGRTPICGGQCEQMPPHGSGRPCQPNSPCPSGEFCKSGACENNDLQNWNSVDCADCGFYNAPDCCYAWPGTRPIEFARAIEAKAAEAVPDRIVNGCRPSPDQHTCLIESICAPDLAARVGAGTRQLVGADCGL